MSAVSPPAHLCLSVWGDVVLYTELTQKVVCPNSRRQSLCTDLLFVFLRCFLCYFVVLFYFCFHFYCTRLKVNHLTMMFAVSHIFLFIIVIRMYICYRGYSLLKTTINWCKFEELNFRKNANKTLWNKKNFKHFYECLLLEYCFEAIKISQRFHRVV